MSVYLKKMKSTKKLVFCLKILLLIIIQKITKLIKSKVYTTIYYTNSENDDHVRVECTDWSQKIENEKNWSDNLGVSAVSDEINKW